MSHFPNMKNNFGVFVEGGIIRRATNEDYQAVIDINRNIYQGRDSLQFQYHEFIADRRRHCFVCIKDDQIVGFVMFSVLDGGQSVISQAGRVKWSYQGQGVASLLLKHGLTEVAKKHPIKRLLWITRNATETRQLFRRKGEMKCFERECMAIFEPFSLQAIVTSQPFRKACVDYDITHTRMIAYEQLISIMSSLHNTEELFPLDTAVIHWEPLRLIAANLSVLREMNAAVFATFENQNRLKCVSFGKSSPTSVGRYFTVDVYFKQTGDEKRAENLVISHVLNHLLYEELQHRHDRYILLVTHTEMRGMKVNNLALLFQDVLVHLDKSAVEPDFHTQYMIVTDVSKTILQTRM